MLSWILLLEGQQQDNAKPADIRIMAKQLVELFAKGDFVTATRNFDNIMKNAMPPDKLQQVWKTLIARVGSFKNQKDLRIEKFQEYTIVFVNCQFEKSLLDIKVVFNSSHKIVGLWFLTTQPSAEYKEPSYARSVFYREKTVLVGSGEWTLPGTLTVPVEGTVFPAVLLVHGSGPQDSDETIGPNKPFKDLALGLASHGIAVLRYEKRTKQYLSKFASINYSITPKEETIDDALAAVALLRNTPGINPTKIFILGHSFGGMLIPKIASLDPSIRGFIIMAGSNRSMEDVLLEQLNYISSLDNAISKEEVAELKKIQRQVDRIKDPTLNLLSTETLLGVPAKYWLYLRVYNPTEMAKKIIKPVLVLQGGRDYQVTMKDYQNWKTALSAKKNVAFKFYPDLNHLFVAGKGKSTPSEYELPANVSEIVIDDISNWIKKVAP